MHVGLKGCCLGPGLHTLGTGGLGPASLSPSPPLGRQDQDQLGVLHPVLHQKEGEGKRVAALQKVICTW